MSDDQRSQTSPTANTDLPPISAAEAEPETINKQAPSTAEKPTKKSSKKILIAVIIAILLIMAGLLAYFLWYQNPDKVVTDGIRNALVAKSAVTDGTATIESDQAVATLKIASKSSQDDGSINVDLTIRPLVGDAKSQTLNLRAEAVRGKDDTVYIKLTNLKPAIDRFLTSQFSGKSDSETALQQQLIASMSMLTDKFDGQWIKFASADLAMVGNQQCVSDAIGSTATQGKELANIYRDNKFIKIEENLGVKNGSQGYRLSYDRAAAAGFMNAVKTSELAKKLEKCSIKLSDFDANKVVVPERFELWVDQWTHQISRVVINDKKEDTTTKLDLGTNFNVPVSVDVPKDAKTFQQIQQEIGQMTPIQPL